jgi:hypothetical protein
MNRLSRATLTALFGVGVLLMPACGADDTAAAPSTGDAPAEEPTAAREGRDDTLPDEPDEPDEPDKSDTETESADDCEITEEDDTCEDTTPQDGTMEGDEGYVDMLADAAELVGMAESELPRDVRIGRRGDEWFALTEDYVVGRRTIELDRDDAGTYVVTSLVLEAEGGPVRMPPED